MNGMFAEFLLEMQSGWRRQKTIRQLSALSDHALKDIGLDRSEIRSVAEDLAANRDGSRVPTARSTIRGAAVVSTEYALANTARHGPTGVRTRWRNDFKAIGD